MRLRIVFHLIRDELYHHRQIIYACLFFPLILSILVGWKNELLNGWLQGLGIGTVDSFGIMYALLVFIPAIFIWIFLTNRLSKEERSGFYLFSRTMPITPEETVTAKFLVSLVLNVGFILWFVFLWWGYSHYLDHTAFIKIWASVYLLTFFFSILIAFHHGMFFRSGAQETWFIYFFPVIIVFLGNGSFIKRWMESFSHILRDYPVLLVGIGILLLLLVWLACWRWALISYRRHVSGK